MPFYILHMTYSALLPGCIICICTSRHVEPACEKPMIRPQAYMHICRTVAIRMQDKCVRTWRVLRREQTTHTCYCLIQYKMFTVLLAISSTHCAYTSSADALFLHSRTGASNFLKSAMHILRSNLFRAFPPVSTYLPVVEVHPKINSALET